MTRGDHEPRSHEPLTDREREVLDLIRQGLTNREIADALTVSPATVASHVQHILAKLGAPNRAAAVALGVAAKQVRPQSVSPSMAIPTEPGPSGLFVGREREMAALRRHFDEAAAGRPILALLAGEPGIGKTRTAQELADYARSRGAGVSWGRIQEAPGAPAYWPWVQIGRQCISGEDALRALDPATLAELSRLFPSIPAPPLPERDRALAAPELSRFRLFDSFVALLEAVAARRPHLVVLDDLHWADRESLLLLEHVIREIAGSPILFLGTYRDSEVDRHSPLTETLATLTREAGFERLTLGGLSRGEVRDYLLATGHASSDQDLVDRIYEKTEGNAFFISQVVNLLAEEEAPASRHSIPDGVREALGRRLNLLSAETNRLLEVAAVMGREFTFEALRLHSVHPTEQLVAMFDEALRARLIEEVPGPGRYRFRHALMQETVLSEVSSARAAHLHGEIACLLERSYGDQAEDHAAELAAHFFEATTLDAAFRERALHYSELAGRQAESTFAWAEAASHYAHCTQLLAGDATRARDLAEMQLCLGSCQDFGGDFRGSWRSLMDARATFMNLGDRSAVGRATLTANRLIGRPERRVAMVEEALEFVGDSDPAMQARLIVALLPLAVLEDSRRAALTRQARELGERFQLLDVLATLDGFEAIGAIWSHDLAAEEKAAKAAAMHIAVGQYAEAGWLKFQLGVTALRYKPLGEGDRLMSDALEFARKFHIRILEINTLIRLTGLATARLDNERFASLMSGFRGRTLGTDLQRAYRLQLAGRFEEAVDALPDLAEAGRNPMFEVQTRAARTQILFRAGRRDDAAAQMATTVEWVDEAKKNQAGMYDGIVAYMLCELDEVLLELGSPELWLRVFEATETSAQNWDPVHPRSLKRVRGQISFALGRIEEAAALLEAAREWSSRERLPVEEARSLEALAKVAQHLGQRDAARVLFKRAAAIYADHGVVPFPG